MALNPDLIELLLSKLNISDRQTFGSIIAQIFQHLKEEIKDNQVLDFYNAQFIEWVEWYNKVQRGRWYVPTTIEKAKGLAFSLYRLVSEQGVNGYNVPSSLSLKNSRAETISDFNDKFLDYFQLTLNEIIKASPELVTSDSKTVSGETVFIIHGHDNELKTEVQLLLTRAGVNNLVLHEQADKGRTIIDKIVEESFNSNYAIALLSPDDKLENGSAQARQNVILEIGYFIGKLGKERVRLLKKGTIDIPSDLQGILYENYDISGAWKMKICKELIAVGIFVDIQTITNKL